MLKSMSFRTTLVAIACAISMSAHAIADEPKKVDIPAGDLRQALLQLSKQYGADLVYRPEQVTGLKTRGAHGELTTKQAVSLLLEGTPLEVRTDPSGAMLIAPQRTFSLKQGEGSGSEDPPERSHSHKSSSGDGLRLAQVDQGQTSSPSTVKKEDEQVSKRKPVQLEEVVVTGSRIPTTTGTGAQDVKVYDRKRIEQSGQTTVADFFNTLPQASSSVGEGIFQAPVGSNSVRLRGLPFGTTLVLINGRRVETSGLNSFNDFFDLNNIPLAAVDRIEVVADGSSAVYGSDALAGVVNVILRKNVQGTEIQGQYGGARGIDETRVSGAWGTGWNTGSISLTASYLKRGDLNTTERAITADSNYTRFGGPNRDVDSCPRANVYSLSGSSLSGTPPGAAGQHAALSAGAPVSGAVARSDFDYDRLNTCSFFQGQSLIPKSQRYGAFLVSRQEVGTRAEVFLEALYSRVEQRQRGPNAALFSFQSFSLPESSPYNPFGQPVGIAVSLPIQASGQYMNTDFLRVLGGFRGRIGEAWHWEIASQESVDWQHATTVNGNEDLVGIQTALNSGLLNPFADLAGRSGFLQSFFSDFHINFKGELQSVDGFVRGPLATLPGGPIEMLIGGEVRREKIFSDYLDVPGYSPNTISTYSRRVVASFGELRLPLLPAPSGADRLPLLVATIAGRYDRYYNIGGVATPQAGIEFRPTRNLLWRGTFARAFKAPSLYNLYGPVGTTPSQVLDPKTGQTVNNVDLVYGGNPDLKPMRGRSYSLGFSYVPVGSDIHVSATYWNVIETDAFQTFDEQFIVDNEALFPDRVVRDSRGNLIRVIDTALNFGSNSVSGIDYELDSKFKTAVGTLSPSLALTQFLKYKVQLVPAAPAVNGLSRAQDSSLWAPRWKSTAALGWQDGAVEANVAARYTGSYTDYDRAVSIGNFVLWDANARYTFTNVRGLAAAKGGHIEVGGINIFNRLPQFSNFATGYSGYDPAQADIRGRFLYVRLGAKF